MSCSSMNWHFYEMSWLIYEMSCLDYEMSCLVYEMSYLDYEMSCLDYEMSCLDYEMSCVDYEMFCLDYEMSCLDYEMSCLVFEMPISKTSNSTVNTMMSKLKITTFLQLIFICFFREYPSEIPYNVDLQSIFVTKQGRSLSTTIQPFRHNRNREFISIRFV